jgi:hypothetical protein
MGVSIEPRLFARSLDELRASSVTTTTTAVAAPQSAAVLSPTPAQQPEQPPQRRVVRIIGMDEGVKEIPYEVKRPD